MLSMEIYQPNKGVSGLSIFFSIAADSLIIFVGSVDAGTLIGNGFSGELLMI